MAEKARVEPQKGNPMIEIAPERLAKLDEIQLGAGSHNPPNGEFDACVMEMTSYLAGEDWSDSPECVSPVIAAFMRRWNDDLDDKGRQMLKPYAVKVIGTRDDRDEERAWMATDWLVRVHAPAWLELAGVTKAAKALRSLPPLTAETVKAAQPTIDDARKKGDAAWAAARDAAWKAARDAAEAAAGAAARDAAEAAAWAAARDAAWEAAWAAARDAAEAAAGAALDPTKQALQESARGLLDRMIALGGLTDA